MISIGANLTFYGGSRIFKLHDFNHQQKIKVSYTKLLCYKHNATNATIVLL